MGKASKHSPVQVVNLLRQIEVAKANKQTNRGLCTEAGITKQI